MTAFLSMLAAIVALAMPVAGFAQTPAYPAKPIRLIVPFPPGAGTDTVARFVALRLSQAMNATIVVDNRTGAGGAIGAAEAARAEPDGYTLLFVAGPFTTVAAASRNPGYDPIRQFAPAASIATSPLVFVVNPSVPAASMREFIALAKREPGKLNYGSAGQGSINHLALELLNARAGTDIVHVPYKGIAPATLDLISGQIQAMTGTVSATLPVHHRPEGPGARGHRRAPRAAAPRCPDMAGGGHRQRRRDQLLGHRRARRHAARDRDEAQCRRERPARATGRAGPPGEGGRRGRRRLPRAPRFDHRGRPRRVEEAHRARRSCCSINRPGRGGKTEYAGFPHFIPASAHCVLPRWSRAVPSRTLAP